MEGITLEYLEQKRSEILRMKDKEFTDEGDRERFLQSVDRQIEVLKEPLSERELKLLWYLRHSRESITFAFLKAAKSDYEAYTAVEGLKKISH